MYETVHNDVRQRLLKLNGMNVDIVLTIPDPSTIENWLLILSSLQIKHDLIAKRDSQDVGIVITMPKHLNIRFIDK